MNTYVILLENMSKPLNQEIIRAHVDHLKLLDTKRQLVICGPFTDYAGGIVIINCDDLDTAHKIAQSDPFVAQKFRSYSIRSLEVANNSNNFLL